MPVTFGNLSGADLVNAKIVTQSSQASKNIEQSGTSTLSKWLIGVFTLGIGAIVMAVKEHNREVRNSDLARSVLDLKGKLDTLKPGEADSFDLEMNGTRVHMDQDASGVLKARIGYEEIVIPFTAKQLSEKLEDDIMEHVRFYGKDAALALLKPEKDINLETGTVDSRNRSLCLKAIESTVGLKPAELSSITTAMLNMIAPAAISGQLRTDPESLAGMLNNICNANRINDEDCLDLLQKLETEMAKDAKGVKEKVDIKISDGSRTKLQRSNPFTKASQQEVHNFVADLIYNKETWIHDQNMARPGERLRQTLLEHSPAISDILKDRTLLNTLDDKLKGVLNDFLDQFVNGMDLPRFGLQGVIELAVRNMAATEAEALSQAADKLVEENPGMSREDAVAQIKQEVADNRRTLTSLEGIEKQIDGQVQTLSYQLQETVIRQFEEIFASAPKNEDKGAPAKEKSLDDMLASSGMDLNSDGYGKFMKTVLTTYFSKVPLIDQKSMLAAGIRYATKDSSDGVKLGAILKGAGPIMQKMLQGFNTTNLDSTLREALQDMKSNLAPIPMDVIQAHLLDMVNRSHGQVTKIEVNDSLGAASVGQALLCKIYTKANPEGVDCVIKLLRPDVQNRAAREKEIFSQAAAQVPGMDVTFAGQLGRIMDELDLTIEAGNVKKGEVYESQPYTSLHSMKLNPYIEPTASTMVLEKAPGVTMNTYVKDVSKQIDDIVQPLRLVDDKGAPVLGEDGKPLYVRQRMGAIFETQKKLQAIYDDVATKQQFLINLTTKWVTEGIYAHGFYHGDLHAGNMMVDKNGLTLIDYGNATTLTPDQQEQITLMMAAAAAADTASFMKGYKNLLSDAGKAKFDENWQQVEAKLDNVLHKGEMNDAGKRIAVALTEIQKLGIECPAPIFNFSQCQIRLQGTIDSLNSTLDRLEEEMKNVFAKGDGYKYGAFDNFGSMLSQLSDDTMIIDMYALINERLTILDDAEGFKINMEQAMATNGSQAFDSYMAINKSVHDLYDAYMASKTDGSSPAKQKDLWDGFVEALRAAQKEDITQLKGKYEELAQQTLAKTNVKEKGLETFLTSQQNDLTVKDLFPHKQQTTFCGCMATVIHQNLKDSMSRIGMANVWKYKSVFV